MSLRTKKKELSARRAKAWPAQTVRLYQHVGNQQVTFDITRTVENAMLVRGKVDGGQELVYALTGTIRNGMGTETTKVWAFAPVHGHPVVWFVGTVDIGGWVQDKCPACDSPAPNLYPAGQDCGHEWHRN